MRHVQGDDGRSWRSTGLWRTGYISVGPVVPASHCFVPQQKGTTVSAVRIDMIPTDKTLCVNMVPFVKLHKRSTIAENIKYKKIQV